MTVDKFMELIVARHPAQPEFHQAVREVAKTVLPFMAQHKQFKDMSILERLCEPDRIVSFRVCWEDDRGKVQVNRGFRVQFNNAIGPYKGGLRFSKHVRISTLKFLAFEQTFKNALTTLPMGGAKGGADFDPKGKSDREVMRFCQSFMTELFRYIGKDRDIPAGDIGCGVREISYLFGQYKRLQNEFTGAMTGKGLTFGGSPIRTEATGYGCVYFAREMLARHDDGLAGKVCVISGAGNVALYTAQKLIELGAKVVALSDSAGFIHEPHGVTASRLEHIIDLKMKKRGRLETYAKAFRSKYFAGKKPWGVACDLAFPCAVENDITEKDARQLLKNGCQGVIEGANMPTTQEAVRLFEKARVLYAPGKAANAGGVAISGLERTQNAMYVSWPRERVDEELNTIMKKIHEQCVQYGLERGYIDYVKGANIAGFIKVGDAMTAYGIV